MATAKKPISPRQEMRFTRIYLWRHPEVLGSEDGKFWGQTDVSLTRRGKDQQKAVAKYMSQRKLTSIYCSDLQRTQLVADAIGRAFKPRKQVTPLPQLRELSLGEWEGMTYHEIDKKFPGALAQRAEDLAGFRIQGGESLHDLAERVIPAFQEIVAKNEGGLVCIVAHAGVNRVILTKVMGAPLDRIFRLDQAYAALNVIDVFEDGLPLIRNINYQPARVD
jgi:alpha-ribazole phosphatase/probable phosphoglycerate mutase